MSAPPVVGQGLARTSHPLQRAGAWAVSVLADRSTPYEVTQADLDAVAARLVDDVATAAVAPKDSAAYDWWKVLFALYPNSRATHSKRPRERGVLLPEITALFAPDAQGSPTWPCTFCGTPAAEVWTKSKLPMYDTNKALNTLPPGVAGWPICRGCRIAAWALPYGAWVTAGSATVLSCEHDAAEREFATSNVLRAKRIMQLGFDGLGAGARPEAVVLRALKSLGPDLRVVGSTLWSFKNDNQEPWLRVTRTRRAVPSFLATVAGNAEPRRGWRLLELALTRRDKSGQLVTSGSAEAARLLFEAEDGRSRSLLLQLHYLLDESGKSWSQRNRAALTRLAFIYAEEILGMNPDLKPVATVIADWIEHGSGAPRGRLAEYRNVALSDYKLGALLMQAHFRLTLDGRDVKAGPEDWRPLIQQRPRAWEQRMLLSATVLELLQERGVAVNEPPADREDEARTERLVELPILSGEDDEHDDLGAA
ncbi:CRISPR-associated protein Cst1 [Streptomyces sp. ScaeMP-e83]|nr:CRISPR-associated protein Cst1 [Streptomyces sp. ScaeMP-e83]